VLLRFEFHDVRRLGGFLAFGQIEAYAITFGEGFEAVTHALRKVDKYVRTVVLLDEPKTLRFVEPF